MSRGESDCTGGGGFTSTGPYLAGDKMRVFRGGLAFPGKGRTG